MDGNTTAIIIILAVLIAALLASTITFIVFYVKQIGKTDKVQALYNETCDRLGAATREAESLKVQLAAKEKALEAAKKTAEELIHDATTAHPPGGPLAGPPEPDPG